MQTITVDGLHFVCDTELEVYRAKTLLTKEPGTIAWLNQLQPGDVFYDVGANIGCYTLYAARRGAEVYAFEPHLVNASHLLRNVIENGFGDRVHVVPCAVSWDDDEIVPFHYTSIQGGSSGSQINEATGENGKPFTPEAIVYMRVTCLAVWLDKAQPNYVKIDVDGHEAEIVNGLYRGVVNKDILKSIQVETRASNRKMVEQWMRLMGYAETSRHFTSAGQQAFNSGVERDSITDNTIFERVAVLETT